MQFSTVAALLSATAAVRAAPSVATSSPQYCNNQGLNYELWIHASPDNATVPADWDPSSLDRKGVPDYNGRLNYIGCSDDSFSGFAPLHTGSIYGNPQVLTGHVGLKHNFYIYAYMKGDYTFTLTETDDAAYIYAGKDCLDVSRPHNRAGVSLLSSETLGQPQVSGKLSNVPMGQWIPVENRWANVMQGPYKLALTVTGPDGQVLLNSTYSNYVVHSLCSRNARIYEATGLSA